MPNPITKHNQKLSNLYFIMLFIVLVYLVYIKVIAMGAFETRHTLLCRANIMQGERNGKEKAFFSFHQRSPCTHLGSERSDYKP